MALFVKADGTLELRVPPSAKETEIRKFLAAAAPWAERRLKEREAPLPAGTVMVEGRVCRIGFSPLCRQAEISAEGTVTLPERCRGSADLVKRHMEALYKRITREKIFPVVLAMAEKTGKSVNTLKISGAVSRWGSCSSSGNINISWRTARLPEHLAELVAAHEAVHLTEMNHSVRFYALLDKLVTDRKAKEKELKQERYKYADQ